MADVPANTGVVLPEVIVRNGAKYSPPLHFLIMHTRESPKALLPSNVLYKAYKADAIARGLKWVPHVQLGSAASDLGWKRGKNSTWYYIDRELK